jgi:hypothetical protein
MGDGVAAGFDRAEVEAAWADYQGRGGIEADRPDWARHPALSLWVEWSIVDGDRVAYYVWHNLSDPSGGSARYAWAGTGALRYTGDGAFAVEGHFHNSADRRRVTAEWEAAGGTEATAPDPSLRGVEGWSPEPRTPAYPRAEVEAEFEKYRLRAARAVETGDWDQWADQFTDDAHYREHHYGYFTSGPEIRAWIKSVMQPFPTMEFPVSWRLIDGNRVSALIPNILPPPEGDDGYYGFDVNTMLHYAGNGQWSYEEDVYSPRDAEKVVGRWVAAGGVIPGA